MQTNCPVRHFVSPFVSATDILCSKKHGNILANKNCYYLKIKMNYL
jgi:hypothetical protein